MGDTVPSPIFQVYFSGPNFRESPHKISPQDMVSNMVRLRSASIGSEVPHQGDVQQYSHHRRKFHPIWSYGIVTPVTFDISNILWALSKKDNKNQTFGGVPLLLPSVTVYIAMKRCIIFSGKTHYFYGHVQQQPVSHCQRGYHHIITISSPYHDHFIPINPIKCHILPGLCPQTQAIQLLDALHSLGLMRRPCTKMTKNTYIWVNYNNLTIDDAQDQGNHPQMALIQVSE